MKVNDEVEREKQKFLYPLSKYYGKLTPQRLIFDANLQEFSQRVSFICALESNGKMTGEEAYQEIKKLWKQLKIAKHTLLDESNLSDDNSPENSI